MSPTEIRLAEKATLAMLIERAHRLAHGDSKTLWTLLKSAERVAPVLAKMPACWQREHFDADKAG